MSLDRLTRNSGITANKFPSIDSAMSYNKHRVGDKFSTGLTEWLVVTTQTQLPLQGGLFADPISNIYISDFKYNHIQKLNELTTRGIQQSYTSRSSVESFKYSLKPITVIFNEKVTSSVPLLLMHHVEYKRAGSGMYFNRRMNTGIHYSPSNLESCATEPVVFESISGSFIRKSGALIGTTDNPVSLGDSTYVTLSDGCDVSIDITTSTGVKLGFNLSCCPGITGDRPSVGVAEQAGDSISVPKVAMYISRSWTHSIYKPMLRSANQSIVYAEANAGGKVIQPYCQRDGSFINSEVPYPVPEAVSAGKVGSTAITILGSLDFSIDTPTIENWRYPIIAKNADVRITEPHVEGDVAEHNIITLDSYIDVDNWSGLLATGSSTVVHSLGQDGADRAVILRGMPMRLGPANGVVGGTYTRPFLLIEDFGGAVADYGRMGDWHAVRRLDLSIVRSIFIDPSSGNDSNMGLTSNRPVRTMSTAIKVLNTVNRVGSSSAVTDINLKGNVVIDTITRAFKPFALWGNYSITAQASAYIELYDCGIVQLRQPTVVATASSIIRHVAGVNTILCDSTTVTGVAVCQTAGSGTIHLSVINSNTSGISKYIDGSGATITSLIVSGGSRNTAIDANPTGIAQLVLGTKYS